MDILIIEDESLAADRLEQMIKDIDPGFNVIAKLGSIKESAKWLLNNCADLIMLDIQLSDGISFSIFDQVAVTTPVIFTTAYDQYAIKAFDLNSIAYLLKPIKKIELADSLKKYDTLKSAFAIDFQNLLAGLQGVKPEYKKRFLIQTGEKIKKVESSEVGFFYILEKGVYMKTFQGSLYSVEYTLDGLENILDPEVFFRINRKYIINIEAIANMVAYSRGRIKLDLKPAADDESDTIVSIDRSSEFKKWLNS
jgi:DNA-binding LytR/AlgR family response regulator